jgi:hypothetical protein
MWRGIIVIDNLDLRGRRTKIEGVELSNTKLRLSGFDGAGDGILRS